MVSLYYDIKEVEEKPEQKILIEDLDQISNSTEISDFWEDTVSEQSIDPDDDQSSRKSKQDDAQQHNTNK